MKEYPIEHFLGQINQKNRQQCFDMHQYFMENYNDAKWSWYKHQAWQWWYQQHIKDILNLSYILYNTIERFWETGFKVEDSYEALFLHDIEKPVKYTKNRTEEVILLEWKGVYEIRDYFINKFWIIIRPEIGLALKYMHGEWDDYSPTQRKMSPLWAHCHNCDTYSARVFFDKNRP